jgi:hypothetical protein
MRQKREPAGFLAIFWGSMSDSSSTGAGVVVEKTGAEAFFLN